MKVKQILKIVGIILAVIIFPIPLIALILLYKNNKSIVLYPKIKIVSIKNNKNIDTSTIESAIKKTKELKKTIYGERNKNTNR
jgi:hypothetical protein